MSETEREETHFRGAAESPELENYRPISPLVIVACVAGLASMLAVVHPLLWILPAVAIVLSVCAVAGVSAAHGRYSGRGLAIAALCLAALVGAYAPTRTLSRERALNLKASEKIEEWISMLQQGRVYEAHQLTMKTFDRYEGPKTLAVYYTETRPSQPPSTTLDALEGGEAGGPSPARRLDEFVSEQAASRLLAYGEQSQVEHVQNIAKGIEYGDLKIVQRYRASGLRDGQPESIEFLISATRQVHENGVLTSWSVDGLKLVE